MKTDIGEYVVGAWLKMIEKCDFVDYNVHFPGGGREGLNEMDIVGLNFKKKTAYLCEVTTHVRGIQYTDNKTTVEKIIKKYETQRRYARKHLKSFPKKRFMFWSPVVPVGFITDRLLKIHELELMINGDYTEQVRKLEKLARKQKQDTNNPFFRMLQIMASLRKDKMKKFS
ncbi:MAG TPA: hypothetical protein VK914_05820 [bacterium]|jgi:hypothetical protein|nr:hypothetical protein [bacterium]